MSKITKSPPVPSPWGSSPGSYYIPHSQQLTGRAPAPSVHTRSLNPSWNPSRSGHVVLLSALLSAQPPRSKQQSPAKGLEGLKEGRLGHLQSKAEESSNSYSVMAQVSRSSTYNYYSPPSAPNFPLKLSHLSSSAFVSNSISSFVCRVLIIIYFGALNHSESSHLLGD